jgi:hypothetical protein
MVVFIWLWGLGGVLSSVAPLWAQPVTPPEPAGEVRTVGALGIAPIEGGDIAQAREKAIQAALVDAASQVAQELDGGQGAAAGQISGALAVRIENQPAGFIRTYRVTHEEASEDGTAYSAAVEADVALDALQAALEERPGQERQPPPAAARPAILLAIAEQDIDEYSPRYWWAGSADGKASAAAQALEGILTGQNYPLVDHRTAARDSRFTARYPHPQLSDAQALDLGARLGADLVIHGEARAMPGPASLGTNITTCRGTLQARLLHVGSGRRLKEITETAVTVGSGTDRDGTKALQRAAAAVAEQLRAPLAELVQGPAGMTRDLELVVTGTADLERFVRLRRGIASLPGVGDLTPLELQGNEALLQVAFSGSRDRLVALLQQRLAVEMNLSIEPLGFARLQIVLPPSRPGSAPLEENPLGN